MAEATLAPAPGAEQTLHLVVEARHEAADGVAAFALRAPDGAALPAWEPGAHVDLVVDGFVRQYSLCGDPADTTTWRVAVLREDGGRGGSRAVHATLVPGATVEVRGPRNHFRLAAAPAYLFVAGGIGITPVLPMARAAARAGVPFRLVYGGRSAASMAFADDVQALGGKGSVALVPQDTHGLLPVDALVAWAAEAAADVYCCGPEPLLDAVLAAGAVLGPDRVHVERFRAAEGAAATGTAFEVEVRPAGVVLAVPADRSLLEVLEDAGVAPFSSCREGTCGTCEVGVVEGEVDHRDALLTPAERAANEAMFPCVSRAAGPRLVIEV